VRDTGSEIVAVPPVRSGIRTPGSIVPVVPCEGRAGGRKALSVLFQSARVKKADSNLASSTFTLRPVMVGSTSATLRIQVVLQGGGAGLLHGELDLGQILEAGLGDLGGIIGR
jgi:hypothetical protein